MSSEESKIKHSKRLQKEGDAIKRQQKIAKAFGADQHQYDGHYFAKHHALNCGNPKCFMCANPRKVFKEKTIKEKSFEQTRLWDE